MKRIGITALLAIVIFCAIGVWRNEQYHLRRFKDWQTVGAELRNELEEYHKANGRYPSQLSEIESKYTPSNATHLDWRLIYECCKYQAGTNSYDLAMPFDEKKE